MGHFAKVADGKVTQVIVAEPEFFQTFVDSSPGQWLQTSYNTRGGVHYQTDTNTPYCPLQTNSDVNQGCPHDMSKEPTNTMTDSHNTRTDF